jgi:hypothetical protein
VQERVFSNINVLQGAKAVAGVNAQFGEVWFFYASAMSVENDSYAVWNYKENTWYVGTLSRTAWADRDAWPFAVGAGADGTLYQHEQDWTDSGNTRVGTVFAESGPILVGNGDSIMDVSAITLDTDAAGAANVQVRFLGKNNPLATLETSYGPFANPKGDGYLDARFSARQIKVRVELMADGPFDFGTLRLDAQKGSQR